MKTKLLTLVFLAILPMAILAQEKESLYIEWGGDDEIANAMVQHGMDHFMNIEFEKAYAFFEAAVKRDPSLFAPHVALANLSKGDKKEYHKKKANELVEGKNEVSKMYVSLLDIDYKSDDAAQQRRETWKKMHELAFNGRFVHFNYAWSQEDVSDRIAELEKLAAKNEKDNYGTGHIHNLLGYAYYSQDEKSKAKAHFEKYLELRPNGYNAQDSMGEFYLNEGDLESALAYYQKAVENYPGASNAKAKIKEIEEKMPATDQK